MKIIYLVISFYLVDNPDTPRFLDGWHPLEQPSIEICEERKQKIEEYLELITLPENIINYTVECEEIS